MRADHDQVDPLLIGVPHNLVRRVPVSNLPDHNASGRPLSCDHSIEGPSGIGFELQQVFRGDRQGEPWFGSQQQRIGQDMHQVQFATKSLRQRTRLLARRLRAITEIGGQQNAVVHATPHLSRRVHAQESPQVAR